MPTYSITAPNGKTLEITGDHIPNESELNGIFASAGVGTGTTAASPMQDLVGKVNARDARVADFDRNWPANYASHLPRALQSPVATGLSLIQPVAEIANVAASGPAALRAGRAVTSALSQPADMLLNQFVKKVAGDPEALELAATKMRLQAARSQARQVGIKADIAAAEPAPDLQRIVKQADRPGGRPLTVQRPPGATYANPTGATPSVPAGPVEPVASGPVAPAPQAAPAAPEAVAPPIAESGSPRQANSLPDQKALNEEALARRRAEYQAKVKAEAEAKGQPQPETKTKLTAPESKEYMRMRQAGKTHPQAMELIEAQRAFQLRFGTPTPTAAETRFPKGMRDYKTQP